MTLGVWRKTGGTAIMGVDCSTQSFAFAIIDDGKLTKWGEIEFSGKDIYERMLNARQKIDALATEFDINYVAIESAIMVKSVQVAIKMAYVFGAVMSSLLNSNVSVIEVAPISWQSFIGNKILTAAEKRAIQNDFPGKSKTWYTNKYRQFRKDRTRQWVNSQFGQLIESDNITDSVGLGWFAWNKLVKNK